MDEPQGAKTGTTTLALTCKDGIVMATERRATLGRLIGHRETQKMFNVGNHMAVTTAGLVGDAQQLVRILEAEANLYRFRRERPMPVKAAATMLGNLMNRSKAMPYWVQLIVGGWDGEPHIYSVDAAGGAIPDTWTCTGSGSSFVYGVLEDRITDNMDVKQGVDLAVRGLNAAMRRDSASGDGFDVATITKDGFTRLDQDALARRHKALKLPVGHV